MPTLTKIDPEHTPELFYCSRIDNEQTIYDQIAEDTSEINDCLRSLRKKVAGGSAEFKMYADHIEIEYNGLVIARAELVANYYTTSWQSVTFDFSSAKITKLNDGTFRFVVVQGDNVFGLEWSFAYGLQTKQTFYLDVPGRNVRIQWRTEVLEKALAVNREDERGLRYSVDDYRGEVKHTTPNHSTEGWAYHIWTFEPDGYSCDALDSRTPLQRYNENVGLIVDPYLDLAEDGNGYNIDCDGYGLYFPKSSTSNYFMQVRDTSDTDIYRFTPYLNDGTSYYFGYYSDVASTVLEDTDTRVVIQFVGNFAEYNSTTVPANLTSATYTVSIYADRVSMELKVVASGSVSVTEFRLCTALDAGATNQHGFRETDPTETASDGYTTYTGINYMLQTSDEMNIQMINTLASITGTTVHSGLSWGSGTTGYVLKTNSFTSGTSRFVYEIVIDSVNRENSSKLYALAERLEMGDQYTDTTLSLTTGSVTTTNTGATAIGASGFFSDGAWHFQGASDDAPVKLTWDLTRHNPKLVYQTDSGSSTTPTMEVDDGAVTLYDPTAAAYNAARYYLEDITTTAQDTAGVQNWLITMPADSEVTSATVWEINPAAGGASGALTGSAVDGVTESEIVTGGETIIITLTDDTFVTGTSSEDGIAAGMNGGTSWNSEVRDNTDNTDIVLSAGDTVATITLPAAAGFSISADDTITITIPAASLTTSTDPVVATPTFDVTNETGGNIIPIMLSMNQFNGGIS